MTGFKKLKRNKLLILVVAVVLLIFSINVDYKADLNNFVEYHQSGTSWKTTYGNSSKSVLVALGQVNYTGEVESDMDAIGPFKKFLKKKSPVFLPGFKNPCWYDDDNERRPQWTKIICNTPKTHKWSFCQQKFPMNTSLLRCLPYFMLIGQPKSGSTDLFQSIMRHPDVKKGISKEPHWWSRSRHCPYTDAFICKDRQPQSLTEYLDYFNPAAEMIHAANATRRRRLITGEGSQSTLWDHRWWWWYPKNRNDKEPRLLNAHIIRHFLPDMKLVVILRNPVDRLYSEYLYFSANETKSVDLFHSKVTRLVNKFNECLTTKSLRQCVYKGNDKRDRLITGLYAVYLKDWMDIFPRKQLLVLSLDEYSTNPSMSMSKIYTFLDLRDIGKSVTRSKHANTRRPSTQALGKMLKETRHILEQFYRPYNEALSKLMNDSIFLWQT